MHILLQEMHHLNEYLTLCLITIYYHNSKTYADGVFSKVYNLDCVNLSINSSLTQSTPDIRAFSNIFYKARIIMELIEIEQKKVKYV